MKFYYKEDINKTSFLDLPFDCIFTYRSGGDNKAFKEDTNIYIKINNGIEKNAIKIAGGASDIEYVDFDRSSQWYFYLVDIESVNLTRFKQ